MLYYPTPFPASHGGQCAASPLYPSPVEASFFIALLMTRVRDVAEASLPPPILIRFRAGEEEEVRCPLPGMSRRF